MGPIDSLWRAAAWLAFLVLGPATGAWAQVCAAPGASGTLTVGAANTVVNTYYPGAAAGGAAGGSTIAYASGSSRGAATAIAAGDLVLVIQMQDGTGGTTTNNNTYAFPATAAGRYEFARVLSVGTNVLNLTTNLTNSYTQNTATANNQTYQVIRVPQYSTLTISAGASIVPEPWDGTSGGVVAVDVAGAFTNNGSINASYAGFRGNAGASLGGQTGAAALTVATMDYVRADTYLAHGGKGEGIAGTPDRVLKVFSTAGNLFTSGTSTANGTATNLTTSANSISATVAYLTTTGRSYNGGSRAAGAPANAGGGGDDSAPASNAENSGGGGGANAGAGGIGGNTWNTNLAIGGRGGVAAAPSLTGRLVMGGGGGSGSSNNNSALDASGGAGGGIILVKAGSVGGTGALLANGQAGRSIPATSGTAQCPANSTASCDGAGGGGAGGSVVVLASSGTVASASARGGQGGNINGQSHGPGGGGGGGLVVTSTGLTLSASNVTGGIAGLSNVGGTSVAYGAAAGSNGSATTIANNTLPATAGGLPANCLPALTVTKVTSSPASVTSLSPPMTTTYSIVVSNTASRGDALTVTVYDPTLPGGSATVVNPPAPAWSVSASPSACGLASRTGTTDPANGATATFTAGSWSLPGGCTLTYTFTVNFPATIPNGTYDNSAVGWFYDPTSATARTVTAALPAAASGLAANTSFVTGGAAGGSNYDGSNAANTGEDVKVQRRAGITVTKDNGSTSVVSGATTSYTVTVANLGPADSAGAVLTDVPSGLSCTAVTCTGGTGGASCPAAGSVTVGNLLGSGIPLTSFPAGSTLTFTVQCTVTATGS